MKKLWMEKRAEIFLLAFFGVFHIFMHTDYWDDAYFMKIWPQYGGDLVSYTKMRYEVWSSRIFIEMALAGIAALPNVVWKAADVGMVLLLFWDLKWFLKNIFGIGDTKTSRLLALFLCAYPFSTMACTGWMATTMNYLWVVSLGLYAGNRMLGVAVKGEKPSALQTVLAVLAALYAASFESMAAMLFAASLLAVCWQAGKKREKVPVILWLLLAVSAGMLLYILRCPGNRLRPLKDADIWMPEFFELTLPDKIRMGTVTAFMHFVSIPSPIFFIVSALCLAGAVWKKEKGVYRVLAACPVMLDMGWSLYFLGCYLRGSRVFTYQVPKPLLTGGADTREQIALLVCLAVWMGTFLTSVYRICTQKRRFFISLAVLAAGCIPELVVGLTPTVVTSMLRTVIYLYMAFILIGVCLWSELRPLFDGKKAAGAALYVCLGAGIMLNVLQLVRHLLVYG